MTLIVHGRATSSNVQAVMWGAAELGLDVDRRDVGGRFGGTDTPEFRAMTPMGLIPVLQDGTVTMFESAAILRYLVATYDEGGTMIVGPGADTWAEWAKHTLGNAFTVPIFWAHYRTPEPDRDTAAIKSALRQFEDLAAIAMTQRAGRAFLTGDHLSLADIWAGHVLYRYFTLDLPREAPEGLEGYYESLKSRPAYARHVMIDYSELKGWRRN